MNEIENTACEAIGSTSNRNEPAASDDTTPEKIVGIYGLRCRTTNKWYVGQSADVYGRWTDYRRLDCKKQRKLYNALRKYGYNDFDTRIIEICDERIPQDALDMKESMWIRHFNSIEHGYNIREGGSRGRHSEETKRRIGLAGIGKHVGEKSASFGKTLSVETRQKISISRRGKLVGSENPFFGKKHSEETKKKIRASRAKQIMTDETKVKLRNTFLVRGFPHSGKSHSEETKKKLRDAAIKQWEKKRRNENVVTGT